MIKVKDFKNMISQIPDEFNIEFQMESMFDYKGFKNMVGLKQVDCQSHYDDFGNKIIIWTFLENEDFNDLDVEEGSKHHILEKYTKGLMDFDYLDFRIEYWSHGYQYVNRLMPELGDKIYNSHTFMLNFRMINDEEN